MGIVSVVSSLSSEKENSMGRFLEGVQAVRSQVVQERAKVLADDFAVGIYECEANGQKFSLLGYTPVGEKTSNEFEEAFKILETEGITIRHDNGTHCTFHMATWPEASSVEPANDIQNETTARRSQRARKHATV